jgi:hypothetical protein
MRVATSSSTRRVGAAAWPLAARAQQTDRLRRIGVLEPGVENDSGGKAQLSGFTQRLGELGWTAGRNLRIDFRWAAGNADWIRMFAKADSASSRVAMVERTPPGGRSVGFGSSRWQVCQATPTPLPAHPLVVPGTLSGSVRRLTKAGGSRAREADYTKTANALKARYGTANYFKCIRQCCLVRLSGKDDVDSIRDAIRAVLGRRCNIVVLKLAFGFAIKIRDATKRATAGKILRPSLTPDVL